MGISSAPRPSVATASGAAAERGCRWVSDGVSLPQLPAFPELSVPDREGRSGVDLLPLPWLLPRLLPDTERLQTLVPRGGLEQKQGPAHISTRPSASGTEGMLALSSLDNFGQPLRSHGGEGATHPASDAKLYVDNQDEWTPIAAGAGAGAAGFVLALAVVALCGHTVRCKRHDNQIKAVLSDHVSPLHLVSVVVAVTSPETSCSPWHCGRLISAHISAHISRGKLFSTGASFWSPCAPPAAAAGGAPHARGPVAACNDGVEERRQGGNRPLDL